MTRLSNTKPSAPDPGTTSGFWIPGGELFIKSNVTVYGLSAVKRHIWFVEQVRDSVTNIALFGHQGPNSWWINHPSVNMETLPASGWPDRCQVHWEGSFCRLYSHPPGTKEQRVVRVGGGVSAEEDNKQRAIRFRQWTDKWTKGQYRLTAGSIHPIFIALH